MNKGVQLALGAAQLLAKARELTSINIVDTDAIEPLTVMVKSLNEESNLHAAGAVAIEQRLLRLLCNRLRMQRDFAAHPEIAEQKITAPIVIVGMGRTGSTKLQKMLAASGDFNWLPYWQSHNPSLISGARDESPQWRIDDADTWVKWFDEVSPETKYGHAQETHEPEEESYMLEQSLRTGCFQGWTELPSYLDWLFKHDISAQFRYLKQLLQYLQWQGLQSANKRWLLKCPLYFSFEPLLREVFPDVSFVMTHRHPASTMPSTVRLLECFHMPFTEPKVDAQFLVNAFAAQHAGHLQIRANHPHIKFLDIPFEHVIGNVPDVMKKIYAFCAVELRGESLQRIVDWHNANPMNKKGVHKYSLADYGFTEAMIEDAFAGYIKLIAPLTVR